MLLLDEHLKVIVSQSAFEMPTGDVRVGAVCNPMSDSCFCGASLENEKEYWGAHFGPAEADGSVDRCFRGLRGCSGGAFLIRPCLRCANV